MRMAGGPPTTGSLPFQNCGCSRTEAHRILCWRHERHHVEERQSFVTGENCSTSDPQARHAAPASTPCQGDLDRAKSGRKTRPVTIEAELSCSFCLRTSAEVDRMLAGAAAHICDRCVGACDAILSDPTIAFPTMTDDHEATLLLRLRSAVSHAASADAGVRGLVDLLRSRRVSWTRIGAALDVSRQAAWERFG
jgi:ClpX C4-type zinc finger